MSVQQKKSGGIKGTVAVDDVEQSLVNFEDGVRSQEVLETIEKPNRRVHGEGYLKLKITGKSHRITNSA